MYWNYDNAKKYVDTGESWIVTLDVLKSIQSYIFYLDRFVE